MHIRKIQKELEDLGKEQHTQNMDVIKIWGELVKFQNFQINQFELNKEITKSFEYINDRELIRNLQDIDPRKIAQA